MKDLVSVVVLLVCFVAVNVRAEPPVSYGAPALTYQPVTLVYTDSSSSSGYSDASQYVDQSLLARVAQILESSDNAGYSVSSSYGAPSSSYGPPSSSYGPPTRSGGGVLLGQPQRVARVAEFDLVDNDLGYSAGGYN